MLTQTQSPELIPPQQIDIFQHLKININNPPFICDCRKSPNWYCIHCKISVCDYCSYQEHSKHWLISKTNSQLNPDDISKIFQESEKIISETDLFTCPEKHKANLLNNLSSFTGTIREIIDKYESQKKEEIHSMFEHLTEYIESTKAKINEVKKNLSDYYINYKQFFDDSDENASIESDSNIVFLLNYEILKIGYNKAVFFKRIADRLNVDISNYTNCEKHFTSSISKEISNIMFEKFSHLNPEFNINEINDVQLSTELKGEYASSNDKYIPQNHFQSSVSALNLDHFNDINNRLSKYSKQIDQIKNRFYETFQKNKNFNEIEKEISAIENNKQKGSDSLFTIRKPSASRASNQNYFAKWSDSSSKATTKKRITSKEDITFSLSLVRKYFNNVIIDVYESCFRIVMKELQSSHADLIVKVDPEKEEKATVKIMESTNTIVIYDHKNNKITKKKIPLAKNPYGYTVFPNGCRGLLIGDKVYITGGKDEKMEYHNVLIYDRKTEKLKRIMDMIYGHSYHTMIYNDAFETLMVFGGENNTSVEVFDPSINRWLCLPDLTTPRANIFFQFDKPRGLMYAMFGNEGKIIDNRHSDVIEFIDLTNISLGWTRLDYYNKSGVNLKSYLNWFPLSNCLLLAYGGESTRNAKKMICVINLLRNEVDKIDKQWVEQLKNESKRNFRLSSIVSKLNIHE